MAISAQSNDRPKRNPILILLYYLILIDGATCAVFPGTRNSDNALEA